MQMQCNGDVDLQKCDYWKFLCLDVPRANAITMAGVKAGEEMSGPRQRQKHDFIQEPDLIILPGCLGLLSM